MNRATAVSIKAKIKARAAAKPKQKISAYSATEGKDDFPAICREAASGKVYIRDRADRLALAIDPNEPKTAPFVDVPVQAFRKNFSAFAAAAKMGVVFRVTPRGSPSVFVRRHTSYRDALSPVFAEWVERVETAAAAAATADRVDEVLDKIRKLEAIEAVEVIDRFDKIVREMKRISLGHLAFREGQMRVEPDESLPAA